MNETIRTAARVEMARRKLNQTDLAKEIGLSRQYVSELMNGKGSNIPEAWQRIFELFGWQVVVLDKEGNQVK